MERVGFDLNRLFEVVSDEMNKSEPETNIVEKVEARGNEFTVEIEKDVK
jgi:hypothetical protein